MGPAHVLSLKHRKRDLSAELPRGSRKRIYAMGSSSSVSTNNAAGRCFNIRLIFGNADRKLLDRVVAPCSNPQWRSETEGGERQLLACVGRDFFQETDYLVRLSNINCGNVERQQCNNYQASGRHNNAPVHHHGMPPIWGCFQSGGRETSVGSSATSK
jgi:hypothetical protein